MYNEKYREGGGLNPYTAPNLKYDPNKEIVFDEVGNIKVIREKDKVKNEQKRDIKRFFKYLYIFIAVCLVLEIPRAVMKFSPDKWKIKALRPAMIENMVKKSQPTYYQQRYFLDLTADNTEKKKTREEIYSDFRGSEIQHDISVFRSNSDKNSLLFRRADEIRDVLGMPVEDEKIKEYTARTYEMLPDATDENAVESADGQASAEWVEYYLAYSKKDYDVYIEVRYYCDIAISIGRIAL